MARPSDPDAQRRGHEVVRGDRHLQGSPRGPMIGHDGDRHFPVSTPVVIRVQIPGPRAPLHHRRPPPPLLRVERPPGFAGSRANQLPLTIHDDERSEVALLLLLPLMEDPRVQPRTRPFGDSRLHLGTRAETFNPLNFFGENQADLIGALAGQFAEIRLSGRSNGLFSRPVRIGRAEDDAEQADQKDGAGDRLLEIEADPLTHG